MGAHGMGGNDLAGAGGASANDFQQDLRRPHNMSPVGPGQLPVSATCASHPMCPLQLLVWRLSSA